ncbi:hypothetical protein KTD31_01190 [Burkholderia multivorans]|uniref:hypothetical protein n=1 Tax=Burkholderia multivorans TaxID=87883 RepID=UPI001C220B01|nr:hypothetical protein [Burkholderia multivorans]MBU9200017.1 hypothetical protein [Burkholderia multivorans]MDN8078865.1 hypothetical protein [Burkholderia multivorans]
MNKADAIPTSQIPVLKLKCYHMSLHTSTPLTPAEDGAFSVFHSFDLIDPVEGVAELLQAWLAERDGTGGPTLRHIEVEDRHGVHRFADQRCGDIFVFCEDSIAFESYTDSNSVLPDPVKTKKPRTDAA